MSQYTCKIRIMRLFTRQTFAECLPGVTIVLATLDVAEKDLEMTPTKNLPSAGRSDIPRGNHGSGEKGRAREEVQVDHGRQRKKSISSELKGCLRFLFPLFLFAHLKILFTMHLWFSYKHEKQINHRRQAHLT